VLVLLLLAGAPPVAASDALGADRGAHALRELLAGQPEFLPVDEAFRFSAEVLPAGADPAGSDPGAAGDATVLVARWTMPQGYYLYRHAFAAKVRDPAGGAAVAELGELEIPAGLAKVDDYFGAVEVYYDEASVRLPIRSGSGSVEVGITYQGCADAGLCYPPETRWVPVVLPAAGGPAVGAETPPAQAAPGSGATAGSAPLTDDRRLAAVLADSGLVTALLLFFVGGIGLAFTPCVLPMVPILSSIIVGQEGVLTRGRAFRLSLSYVFGMALTYAVIGTLVGLFGAGLNLQAALQSPPVLIVFAALFVLLALSMFGFYELRLPASWQNGLNALGDRVGGGRHTGVFVMGSLSALVVSPCVSAPLAGALIYLSATGDAVLGGSALLALALGMGVPLLVIGASGGHLLPRTGAWMNSVKAVFGVGLLGVAVWLLERVVPAAVTLALWAGLAIGVGVYLGALDFAPRKGWAQLWKATGAFAFIYGVLLLIGAASGAEDPLKPLGRFATASVGSETAGSTELAWQPVRNLADLEAELAEARAAGQPALLDLYADWCISCKVMERSVFPRPEVAARLRQFRLLKADVTANNAEDQALMQAFGLFGPPSMVFFGPDGRELDDVRIQGEIGAVALAAHLGAVLDRTGAATTGEIAANY
jgi:thiol:disulfide interchange protein DsbD